MLILFLPFLSLAASSGLAANHARLVVVVQRLFFFIISTLLWVCHFLSFFSYFLRDVEGWRGRVLLIEMRHSDEGRGGVLLLRQRPTRRRS